MQSLPNPKMPAVWPKVGDLKSHLKKMYAENNWRGYVINYLLMNFHTRNLDLNLEIVPSIQEAKGNKNYLILRANDMVYIRRDYKTRSVYGEKKHKFKDKKMLEALGNISSQSNFQFPVPLLATGKNDKLADDSIARYIRRYTYQGLSESDYFKIFVSEIDRVGNFADLSKMSDRRGTSIETMIHQYHLKFKNKS